MSKPLSDDHKRRAEAVFKAFDSAGKGYVAKEDFTNVLAGKDEPMLKDALSLIKSLDTNKNGVLEPAEWIAFFDGVNNSSLGADWVEVSLRMFEQHLPKESKVEAKKKTKNWLPLESNPTLMNKYISALGVKGSFVYHDVLGVDDELLMMVPRPVIGLLLLFPISQASEAHQKQQQATIAANGQHVEPDLYFIKQTVDNACGTIGLCHTVLNVTDRLDLEHDKFFAKFHEQTKNMNPDQRADALEANDDIEAKHESIASDPEAKSAIPEDVNLHFIAFINKNGHLYEMDGRQKQPVHHGPTTEESFLNDAVAIVKQFMARDPEEYRFNMVAFAPPADE